MVAASGEYRTGNARDFRNLDKYEVIKKDGVPYFLRERHPDFDWPSHVKLYHKYGGQAVLVNESNDKEKKQLDGDLKLKLANVALRLGGVEVRGFTA